MNGSKNPAVTKGGVRKMPHTKGDGKACSGCRKPIKIRDFRIETKDGFYHFGHLKIDPSRIVRFQRVGGMWSKLFRLSKP